MNRAGCRVGFDFKLSKKVATLLEINCLEYIIFYKKDFIPEKEV